MATVLLDWECFLGFSVQAGLPAGGSEKTNKRLGKPGLHSAGLVSMCNGTMLALCVLVANLAQVTFGNPL